MSVIEWDIEQGSDEWFQARLGVVSASCFGEIFTPTGKPATGAKVENYANKLIAEAVTGKREDTFKSEAMERGNIIEEDARSWYSMARDCDVEECGLVYLDSIKRVSCSPDGLILQAPEDVICGLEIKCPLAHTQVKYLLSGKVPTQYIPQLQGSMYVCDVDTWDFLSYHPDLEPLLITVERDDEWIKNFKPVLNSFVDRVQDGISKLTHKQEAA